MKYEIHVLKPLVDIGEIEEDNEILALSIFHQNKAKYSYPEFILAEVHSNGDHLYTGISRAILPKIEDASPNISYESLKTILYQKWKCAYKELVVYIDPPSREELEMTGLLNPELL